MLTERLWKEMVFILIWFWGKRPEGAFDGFKGMNAYEVRYRFELKCALEPNGQNDRFGHFFSFDCRRQEGKPSPGKSGQMFRQPTFRRN